MKTFYAKDGQFWLGDEPLFIHAGEFHYFRTRPINGIIAWVY